MSAIKKVIREDNYKKKLSKLENDLSIKYMNKVILIGNVGADPQVKYLDQGVCVAQLRLATTERGYTLQNGTQVPERTEWHNCVFWRKQAEVVEKDLWVQKGDAVCAFGGANNAIGTLVMRCQDVLEMENAIHNQDDWLIIHLK